MRKFLALLLASVVFASVFSGCGSGNTAKTNENTGAKGSTVQSDPNMAGNMYLKGLPIVKDKVTMKFAACKSPNFNVPMSEMEVMVDLESKTNVHIEWDEIPSTAWIEKVKLMFAGNDLPDGFYGAQGTMIDNTLVNAYAKQGLIAPLDDLINKYGDNIKKALAQRPDLLKMIKSPDGKIYSLPAVNEAVQLKITDMLYINEAWLKKVNLPMPSTTEEFYTTLKAFVEKDANGNGKQDEFAFSFAQYQSPNNISEFNSICSMFGSFGVVDNKDHIMARDGKILYVPIQNGYLEGIRYFNKLYKDKLLDPESFTQNSQQLSAKAGGPAGVGATIYYAVDQILPNQTLTSVEAIEKLPYKLVPPLKGPGGTQLWNDWTYFPGLFLNRFIITTKNKNPEVAIRWADYICDSGKVSTSMRCGTENKAWKLENDGTWNTIPLKADEKTMSPSNFSLWWWLKEWQVKRVADPSLAVRTKHFDQYIKYVHKEPLPYPFQFDEATNRELIAIKQDLTKYVESMLPKFIFEGVTDNQWNEYVQKVKAYKVDRYVEIYQAAYDKVVK